MINAVDKDGSGSIDFPEFLMMMKLKVQDQNQEEEIREAFKVFDNVSYNSSIISSLILFSLFRMAMAYIDRRELALMMRFSGESVSEEEIEEIINEADMDHNGLIDYTEFFMLMSPKR